MGQGKTWPKRQAERERRSSGFGEGMLSGRFGENEAVDGGSSDRWCRFFAGQQAYAKWLDRYENIQPSGKASVPKYNIRNGSIDVSSGNTLMGFNEDGSELSGAEGLARTSPMARMASRHTRRIFIPAGD